MHQNNRNIDSCITLLDNFLSSDGLLSDQTHIAYDIANALRHAEGYGFLAVRIYNSILRSDTDNRLKSISSRCLAKMDYRRGNVDMVIQRMEDAMVHAPDNGINCLWLGNMVELEIKNRVLHLNKALNIGVNDRNIALQAQALIGLGNFYSGNKDNKCALEYYQKALDIAPKNNKAQEGKKRCEGFLGRNNRTQSW